MLSIGQGCEQSYLYGVGRIAQYSATGTDYFVTDVLGSVRQLADADGQVSLAQSFKPYGEMLSRNQEIETELDRVSREILAAG